MAGKGLDNDCHLTYTGCAFISRYCTCGTFCCVAPCYNREGQAEEHMWKRDEAPRPASGQPTAAPQPVAPTAPAAASPVGVRSDAAHHMEKDIVNIGKSVVIKGELNGSEDLTIE